MVANKIVNVPFYVTTKLFQRISVAIFTRSSKHFKIE